MSMSNALALSPLVPTFAIVVQSRDIGIMQTMYSVTVSVMQLAVDLIISPTSSHHGKDHSAHKVGTGHCGQWAVYMESDPTVNSMM